MLFKYLMALGLMAFSDGFKNRNVCKKWSDYTVLSYFDKKSSCWYNEDVRATTDAIAKRHNYQVQTHNVTTEDGFILKVFRIANATSSFDEPRQPILLVHGTLSNSELWIQRGDDSIGFLLADMGYDVWLSNSRGTYYSSTRVKGLYSDYWDHTFDDLAKDNPAVLEYIDKETRQAGNILYLGHSAGNTQMMAYASDRPDHAKKYLKAILNFAPVVYLDKEEFLIKAVKVLVKLPIRKISVRQYILKNLCSMTYVNIKLCRAVIAKTFGPENGIHDPEIFPTFMGMFPDQEGINIFKQYMQLADSAEFKKYDYGPRKNLIMYDSIKPPMYDMSKINIPMYMFVGEDDGIGTMESAKKVQKVMKVYTEIFKVDKYSHLTFFLGNNIQEVLYPPFKKVLEKLR
ncbi:PREDICTED: lipase 1-like [Nicrophorus vespilloides]|uniref:Lipase n=1 Tax=Nicrophorus vespilloides TaxID=110193 RepID=A0ABM1MT62_NICVS|nr:PREDICTED: lipase 1-like [Nicrophorus vespilloides]